MFGGSGGEGWYAVGSKIAAQIQENAGGMMARGAPGGGLANPTTVRNKDGMLGLAYTGVAYEAYLGTGNYTEAHTDICHVISLYSRPFLWTALRESENSTDIYDLADKRISPGRTGLAEHGVDMDGNHRKRRHGKPARRFRAPEHAARQQPGRCQRPAAA